MKKLIALISAVLMLAALAACTGGADAPAPTEAPTAAPTEAPTPAPTEAPTEAPAETADPAEAAVADFAEEFSPRLESMKTLFAGVMELDCYAEGRTFVLEYKYVDKFTGTPELLRKSLDETAEGFVSMYEELSGYADSDEVMIVLRYLDSDGSKILDYVIDKEFAEIAAAASVTEKFDSLEAFVNSDELKREFAEDDDDEMRTEISEENGDTLVITYVYLNDMTDEEKTLFGDLWYAAMAEDGVELIAEFRDMVLSCVDLSDCDVVFRAADKDGNVMAQYPAE